MTALRTALIAALALPCLAQSPKQLFRDASSSVTIQVAAAPTAGGKPRTRPVTVNAVTGIKYWIELQSADNRMQRVNTSYVFKPGDRIRFHVIANVDGVLTIMQSQNREAPQMLFPTAVAPDNRVQKFQEKVFPSEKGFFKFDSKGGNIKLQIMVQAAAVAEMNLAQAGPPPPMPPKPQELPMQRPPVPPVSQPPAGSNPAATEAKERARRATELVAEIQRSKGGKRLEVDESPAEAATYEVVDARNNPKVKPGVIAVEVNLTQTGS